MILVIAGNTSRNAECMQIIHVLKLVQHLLAARETGILMIGVRVVSSHVKRRTLHYVHLIHVEMLIVICHWRHNEARKQRIYGLQIFLAVCDLMLRWQML